MARDKSKKLINMQSKKCRGLDNQGRDAFEEERDIIISVYDNGMQIPTCAYFEGIENPRCNPQLQTGRDKHLDDYWLCKYYNSGK